MTTETWRLHGYGGRLPWCEVREHLSEATCTWQDLDGVHVGPAPHTAPIATHLWGWSAHRYLRARLDGNHAYLAMLTQDEHGTPVEVLPRRAVLRRADTFTGEHEMPELELLEIPGPSPATFLRPAQR